MYSFCNTRSSLHSQEFVDDYNQFRERIADLDRRLASIVCQGFDDCPSTEAALKVKPKLIPHILLKLALITTPQIFLNFAVLL